MSTTLQGQKRAYLQRSVELLKKERGLTQRAIAEEMDETEQELSGKLSDKMQKGITDDYVDRFAAKWKLPFTTGGSTTEIEGRVDGMMNELKELHTLVKLMAKALAEK